MKAVLISPNTKSDIAPIRIATAIPQVEVANCRFNAQHIEMQIKQAAEKQAQIACFPELCITAYTCGDLFLQELLLDEAEKHLLQLVENTADLPILSVVGMPLRFKNYLYNVAVIFGQGQILGFVPKTNLQHEEQRWFTSGNSHFIDKININGKDIPFGTNQLFSSGKLIFSVVIGENSPTISQNLGAIFNISATAELVGKNKALKKRIEQQSVAYIYVSAGFGESTTDNVFAGNAYIAENGKIIASSERFSFEEQLIIAEINEENRVYEPPKNTLQTEKPLKAQPFIPSDEEMDERCSDVFNIQISGLATRIKHSGMKTVIIGVSGGLDSTLALMACVRTFDKLQIPRNQIIGVTMPGFGTTNQSYSNAIELMKLLGVSIREISIQKACIQHFKDIGHDENIHDVVYENAQARERTQILMNIANQTGGFVVGTGNLSELALGWTTYNGDHISMYAINAGIPKTLVSCLLRWLSLSENDTLRKILSNVLKMPVSPELLPAENGKITQKTENLVGPYELHDFFLFYMLRFGLRPAKIFQLAMQAFENKYDKETIKKCLTVFYNRFFSQQFKRSCLPDGPKIGSVCLSPRGSWSMPSDASSEMWLKEIDSLKF